MKTLTAALALVALSATAAFAESASSSDRHFVRVAMEGGFSEVAMARQALARTNDPDSRAFAQQMIADHTRGNAQLAHIASTLGLDAPQRPSAGAREEMDRLGNLPPDAFAREYLAYEVMDHQDDIEAFREERASTANWRLRNYTDGSLLVLREHLRLAQAGDEHVQDM
jgi:putative membrane protein